MHQYLRQPTKEMKEPLRSDTKRQSLVNQSISRSTGGGGAWPTEIAADVGRCNAPKIFSQGQTAMKAAGQDSCPVGYSALKIRDANHFLSFFASKFNKQSTSGDVLSDPSNSNFVNLQQCLSILSEYFKSTSDIDASLINELKDYLSSPVGQDALKLIQQQKTVDKNERLRKAKLSKDELNRELDHSLQNVRFNRIRHSSRSQLTYDRTNHQTENHDAALGLHSSANSIRRTSRVLYVRGVSSDTVTIRELCSLFSNFGNIELGFMHFERQFALIKFTTVQGAELGLKYLRKLPFFDSKLNISFSHFNDLEEKWFNNQKEYFFPDANCRRFKKHVPTLPNAVSRTLHVCVFFWGRRRFVHESEMLQLVLPYAEPFRVQRDENKDNQNMWFMEFSTMKEALLVLMKCHDLNFEDGNIRISFTKSRKI